MNVIEKTRSDIKSLLIRSKDKSNDETEKKYPNGPNEKQGYPDEKQPNKDDLHQDHMIEDDKKPKKDKSRQSNWFNPRDTFKGWTIII